jgi:hypothetical protein
MDIKMQVAIVGFVGVLVGSLVSILGQLVITLWSTRRADRDKRLLVIRAARLIADELNNANSAIIHTHMTNTWYFDPDLCSTEDWKKYRSTIAGALPFADWMSLTEGTLAVKTVRDTRSHTFDPTVLYLTKEIRDVIESLGPRVEKALKTIQPYAAGNFPNRRHRLDHA